MARALAGTAPPPTDLGESFYFLSTQAAVTTHMTDLTIRLTTDPVGVIVVLNGLEFHIPAAHQLVGLPQLGALAQLLTPTNLTHLTRTDTTLHATSTTTLPPKDKLLDSLLDLSIHGALFHPDMHVPIINPPLTFDGSYLRAHLLDTPATTPASINSPWTTSPFTAALCPASLLQCTPNPTASLHATLRPDASATLITTFNAVMPQLGLHHTTLRLPLALCHNTDVSNTSRLASEGVTIPLPQAARKTGWLEALP